MTLDKVPSRAARCALAREPSGHRRLAASVPIVMDHAAVVAGTAAIATAQVAAGDPAAVAALGVLYVWVAIGAVLFFSLVAATIYVTAVVAAQISVAAWVGQAATMPQVLLTAGTCVAVAAAVGLFARNLRQQVVTDPLTGLLNRRGLDRVFRFEIAVAARTRQPLSVAILDLDGFKKINDERGHAAGDLILTDAAHAWEAALEPGDVLCRLGGDEFAALLPGCDARRATHTIARVLGATPAGVWCSAGIAVYDGREDRHELLSRADAALYRAKAGGGARLAIDNPPLPEAHSPSVAARLTADLDNSREIQIAVGILMAQHLITHDDALDLLKIANPDHPRELQHEPAETTSTAHPPHSGQHGHQHPAAYSTPDDRRAPGHGPGRAGDGRRR